MMNCDRVVESIDDYLQELLETDARDGVEVHLQSCAACGEALEKARKTWSVLHEWQPKPPTSRMQKSTRSGLPRPASPPWAPALAVAGAILVMVALAVVYYGRRPAVTSEVYEPRVAQVDEAPPAPPAIPTPERPRIEQPAPTPEAVVPPAP